MVNLQQLRFRDLPVLARVIFYLGANYLLIFLAQMITGFLPVKGPMSTNILLALLLLIFTKFILKTERKTWSEVGCVAGNRKDLLHLCVGAVGGMMMLIVTAYSIKILTGFKWVRNPSFEWYQLFTVFITIFVSAFVQELAFRGYTFRLMLEKWGAWPAQFVTAFFFGLMHLSSNMSIQDALITMLTTGIGSMLFGIAVIKTKRLHLATGIHFGWNYVQYLLPRHPSQNRVGMWNVMGINGQPEIGYLIWILPYIIIAVTAYFIIHLFVKTDGAGIALGVG